MAIGTIRARLAALIGLERLVRWFESQSSGPDDRYSVRLTIEGRSFEVGSLISPLERPTDLEFTD